ncbi:MAG: hypothetical protein NVSMB1_20580 [Polyangiales bacterium]
MAVKFALYLTTLSVISFSATSARAWCRTTTTQNEFAYTDAKPCNDTGIPLFWASRCIGYSLQKDASSQVDLATARTIADLAFGEWSAHECGNDPGKCGVSPVGFPTIRGSQLSEVACNRVEYNDPGGNANIIVFRDGGWIHDPAQLALTTVSYVFSTGEIYDADLEINSDPAKVHITTVDPPAPIAYDFRSILTHEAGHFFGLAHTADTKATMFARYQNGELIKRALHPDDLCAICTVYPPKRTADCNDQPHNYFSGVCGGDPAPAKSRGCSCALVASRSSDEGAQPCAFVLALLTIAGARSRCVRRRCSDSPRRQSLRAPRRSA